MFWFAMIILTILAIPIFYVAIRAAVAQEKGPNEQKYAVFDFLVDQYGFRKGGVERFSAYAGGDCLSFDKQDLKIVICHDYRGEIDGTFTLREGGEAYPLNQLTGFYQGRRHAPQPDVPPSQNKDRIEALLETLARDLAQVGVPLLQHEGAALDEALAPFMEYHELHSELYHECYTGPRDQHTAEALLLAFEQLRFDEVVQHIESLSAPLSEVEQKILAYAQAQ